MKKIILMITALVIVAVGSAFGVEFRHAEHDGYVEGAVCSSCHADGARSIVPAMTACLECHDQAFADSVTLPALDSHGPLWGMSHRTEAKQNNPDCAACHQQDFCMECHKAGFADEQGSFEGTLANVHRSDFQVTHPISARTDPQFCSSCHETDFCVDCHSAFAPADLAVLSHRRGWSDGTLGGAHVGFTEAQCVGCHPSGSVLPSSTGWSISHAREARKNLATCQTCHPEGDICLQCHSARIGLTVNPHPEDWDDMADTLDRASGGRTCRKCH